MILKNQSVPVPVHEISNNVVCATSKATDQPAHTRSLIRAFASRLSILMIDKLLTEHHLDFLSLKGCYRGSSESTLVTLLEITCHGSIILCVFAGECYFSDQYCPPVGNQVETNAWSSTNKVSNLLGYNWASSRQNLSSRYSTKRDSNQSAQLQRLARKLKFRLWQAWIWYLSKSEKQRRWSDCAYAQAGLRLCCSQHPERQVFWHRGPYHMGHNAQMSRDMWFPTMWNFDKKKTQTSLFSPFLNLETPNDVQSVA